MYIDYVRGQSSEKMGPIIRNKCVCEEGKNVLN